MTRRVALAAVALVAVTGLVLFAALQPRVDTVPTATPYHLPSPSPVASSTPGPSPSALPAAAQVIRCTPDPGVVEPVLQIDPCPSAVAAIAAAVGSVGLPIDRLVVEPGPFFCDVIWPGAPSATVAYCAGPGVRGGQFMHAWVSFRGSDKVAAVMLGLDLPENLFAADATRPPWRTTLVAVEVPPAGWVMP